jgi:hypothetical protein
MGGLLKTETVTNVGPRGLARDELSSLCEMKSKKKVGSPLGVRSTAPGVNCTIATQRLCSTACQRVKVEEQGLIEIRLRLPRTALMISRKV